MVNAMERKSRKGGQGCSLKIQWSELAPKAGAVRTQGAQESLGKEGTEKIGAPVREQHM